MKEEIVNLRSQLNQQSDKLQDNAKVVLTLQVRQHFSCLIPIRFHYFPQ